MVSLRSLVEDNMKELENNYLAHTFGLSSHISKSHEGESARMRDYFESDRLGLKSIDKKDINCWKLLSVTSSSGTEGLTPIYASTQEATGDEAEQSKAQKRKKKRKKNK